MPPETKAISDFQNVISSEMDLQEALSSGGIDGFAIRNVGLQRTSFENRFLRNVMIYRVAMPNLLFDGVEANTVQWTESALRGSRLHGCEFDGLNMNNCEAIECQFNEGMIQNSNFFETQLSNASFSRAKIVKSQFQSSELYGANFENALIAQCSFSDPKMGNASLTRTNFNRAMIIDTSLKNANLHAANFADAILIRVDLRGANIVRADMRGAVLIDCQIHPDDKEGAYW
ncbi:MAG: pentapeptide repeat-containing protein [Proteobacteria bacterium]|nr:pentapeptide repeat-containing protein [Pseudomonadota bacterium]